MANFKALPIYNPITYNENKIIYINIDNIVSVDDDHIGFFEITLTNGKSYQIKGLINQVTE